MFKSITVPLDGSELSEKALPYALRLASSIGADLTLLRVVDNPDFPGDPLQKEHLKKAAKYLSGIKDWLVDDREFLQFSTQINYHVLLGNPADEISSYVHEEEQGLVVMTTHGRSGFSRLLMGSVAGKILHRLKSPIMLVRPFGMKGNQTLEDLVVAQDEPYANTFLRNGIRLLVPLDQTDKSEVALKPAFELAKKLNASLYLLKVNLPSENVFYGDAVAMALSPQELEQKEEQEREAARLYLGQVSQFAQAEGIETVLQATTGNPAEEIMQYANLTEPDLIIMATHARGELGRLIYGSVASQVLLTTHIPVLMIPTGKSASKVGAVRTTPSAEKEAIKS